MTGQLSLVLGPPELKPVEWGESHPLPLVRSVPTLTVAPRDVTAPGYHKGRDPGNKGNTYPPEPVTEKDLAQWNSRVLRSRESHMTEQTHTEQSDSRIELVPECKGQAVCTNGRRCLDARECLRPHRCPACQRSQAQPGVCGGCSS